MAEMLLDRTDILAPSSGFVAEEWRLWVYHRNSAESGLLGGVGMARRLLYM
jgi:hypothetical protein